ncbi:PepSY domain-containing protein [Azospirillum halopraeferens]|uniref:PepSY domain-containing protein n=1 Tax=Azospirillum halopraeferens TaxID=34010 RepID=UPI0003F86CCF|nr:PepSY domain-containing protein [Azospirillum halopraeferens]
MLALVPSALAIALAVLPASGRADDGRDDDHDRARQALRDGRVLPLEAIVARATDAFGGTVLDVEIEDDDHGSRRGRDRRLVYEVKMLVPGGHIVTLIYDAGTGDLLASRGRPARRKDR